MNPPLAKKDYVHFTDQGADTLARMMFSDLFASEGKDLSVRRQQMSHRMPHLLFKVLKIRTRNKPDRIKAYSKRSCH
jgi:hypothetical protein